jgi:hypothetical protein
MNSGNPKKISSARVAIPWILIGLMIGGGSGAISAHHRLNRNFKMLSQMMAVSEYQNLALLQYKYADLYHARQSMQDLLSFMNQVEKSGLAVDKGAFEFDRSLAYMRLALLDEKSGDVEASRKHIAEAADCSTRIGNKDASEANLRQVATKLDYYLP